MKRILIAMMILTSIIFAQEAVTVASDSAKIADLTQQNQSLKALIVSQYVQKTGKPADEAFIDLYFSTMQVEKQNADLQEMRKTMSEFIKEIQGAVSMKEVKAVLKKYGV